MELESEPELKVVRVADGGETYFFMSSAIRWQSSLS